MNKKLLIALVLIVVVSVLFIINNYFNIIDLSDVLGFNKKELVENIQSIADNISVKSLEQYIVTKAGGSTSVSIKKYDSVNKVVFEAEKIEDNLYKKEVYIFKKDDKVYKFYGNEEEGFTEDKEWENNYGKGEEYENYASFFTEEKVYNLVLNSNLNELVKMFTGVEKVTENESTVTYKAKYKEKGMNEAKYTMTFENGLLTKVSYGDYDSNNKMTKTSTDMFFKNINNTVVKIPQAIIDMIE